jgi:hypothetical protein
VVPRPRVNLILYYGVLGARAAWRPEVVPRPAAGHDAAGDLVDDASVSTTRDPARSRARGQCWAALMKRTFGYDLLDCPRCGGRLRLISLIEEAAVIGRILRHLGLLRIRLLPVLPERRRSSPRRARHADEYESAP